jgi:hypothetical protein
MAGLSRVGFAMHEPPEKWIEDGHNGHGVDKWEQDPELDNAVLPHNGCIWGNTPTPPHALTAVLLHKKRQFGNHIPATPYGPMAFVPAHADLKKVAGVDDWWHTDGISVWREGSGKLTGAKAGEALRDSFEKAADTPSATTSSSKPCNSRPTAIGSMPLTPAGSIPPRAASMSASSCPASSLCATC